MERELMTVTQVSHMLGLSTRMLRYYEGKGLINSKRREGYAYRMYDGEAVSRLRQIILLRRLRLSLEQIGKALGDPTAREAIRVCGEKLEELGREAAALEAVRDILGELLEALKCRYWMPAGQTLLENSRVMALTEAFAPPQLKQEKERADKMEALNRAEESARPQDVRIIHLPASAVAAARYAGPEPENHAGRMIAEFARRSRLWETGASMRLYGFNSPNPPPEGGEYGYEFWLTIPEDMEVPPPLEKKHFPGGTYAAHCIRMGDFHQWAWLARWVEESEEYEGNGSGTPENMFGGLEEHLNYYDHIKNTPEGEPETVQLDLLVPVKARVRG